MTPYAIIIAKTGCKLCSSLREKMELLNTPCYYISYASSIMSLPKKIQFYSPDNGYQPVTMPWRQTPLADAMNVLLLDEDVDIDKLPTPTAIFQGKTYGYAGVVKAIREYQAMTDDMRKVS